MPSAGELEYFIYDNHSAVDTGISTAKGTALNYNMELWTSTEAAEGFGWIHYTSESEDNITPQMKSNNYAVRCIMSQSLSGGNPCSGITCPVAKSCTNGCDLYSQATDCCASVCTSCHTHSYRCPTGSYASEASCEYGVSHTVNKTCSCDVSNLEECYVCKTEPDCDSSYQYTCSGTGYNGGNGSACGGKYTSCNCSSGYTWDGSACVEDAPTCSDTSCSVGHVYYTDGTCCKDVLSNKTVVGIVVKDNELVMGRKSGSAMVWAYANYDIDINSIANTSEAGAKDDYNGKSNTLSIVSELVPLGEQAAGCAAITCNSYSVSGAPAGGWYLPALGELNSYVINQSSTLNSTLNKLGWNNLDGVYWTSSEYDGSYAWNIDSDGYADNTVEKNMANDVICFLPINGGFSSGGDSSSGGGSSSGGETCDANRYQYTCVGPYISGGRGTACGGKYMGCTCIDGYIFDRTGACVADTSCSVGRIYQSDGTCSINGEYTGTSIPVGIVVKANELVISLNYEHVQWRYGSNVNVSGITDYLTLDAAKTDYSGRNNSNAIISAYPYDDETNNAAKYCNAYVTVGTSEGDWYLPAAGELNDYYCSQSSTIHAAWDKVGGTPEWNSYSDQDMWTSSEISMTDAWALSIGGTGMSVNSKGELYRVFCFLDISK